MPIPLRGDYDAEMVRAAAKRSKDGPQELCGKLGDGMRKAA